MTAKSVKKCPYCGGISALLINANELLSTEETTTADILDTLNPLQHLIIESFQCPYCGNEIKY
ncbi:MAG: hypothetical protein L3V56_14545 [Candidatus Magnetoovum sp. WYHC-5]|nr:hypothetical protein [Candidatus Magnetoovum sp. WYHC-5]